MYRDIRDGESFSDAQALDDVVCGHAPESPPTR